MKVEEPRRFLKRHFLSVILTALMLPLGVIREHTTAGRLAWRTGLYRVGVDSASFVGPLVAGILGPHGEGIFLGLIGAAALALGVRCVVRQVQ